MHQNNVILVIIGTYQMEILNMRHIFAMVVMQKAMCFHDFAIVCIQGSDSRTNFWYMGKNDATNTMKNSNLNQKCGSLNFFYYM